MPTSTRSIPWGTWVGRFGRKTDVLDVVFDVIDVSDVVFDVIDVSASFFGGLTALGWLDSDADSFSWTDRLEIVWML